MRAERKVETGKRPFSLSVVLRRIERAIKPYRKAALFELAELGYSSVFEQLVACVISIRTLDEVTVPASLRLFERARDPAALQALSEAKIDECIQPCTFHRAKAHQLSRLAAEVIRRHGGKLSGDRRTLLSLPGVGPKCTALVLGIACGQPAIAVDVHVHRIANRWGLVATRTPEQTMERLEEKVPRAHWTDINRLLVPFGKHVCTWSSPFCSSCPVLDRCEQVGVKRHR